MTGRCSRGKQRREGGNHNVTVAHDILCSVSKPNTEAGLMFQPACCRPGAPLAASRLSEAHCKGEPTHPVNAVITQRPDVPSRSTCGERTDARQIDADRFGNQIEDHGILDCRDRPCA
jgi:hypothetical protein